MSTLLDPRKTEIIKLPSFPEDEIEIYDGILTGDVLTIEKTDNDYDNGINLLKFIIKRWSFVDEKEKELPVSKETLSKLPVKDFTFLMSKVNKAMSFLELEEQKK